MFIITTGGDPIKTNAMKTELEIIQEYERAQWKPYPEKTPENNTVYLVTRKKQVSKHWFSIVDMIPYAGDEFVEHDADIIAFRKMPKKYQGIALKFTAAEMRDANGFKD